MKIDRIAQLCPSINAFPWAFMECSRRCCHESYSCAPTTSLQGIERLWLFSSLGLKNCRINARFRAEP